MKRNKKGCLNFNLPADKHWEENFEAILKEDKKYGLVIDVTPPYFSEFLEYFLSTKEESLWFAEKPGIKVRIKARRGKIIIEKVREEKC